MDFDAGIGDQSCTRDLFGACIIRKASKDEGKNLEAQGCSTYMDTVMPLSIIKILDSEVAILKYFSQVFKI